MSSALREAIEALRHVLDDEDAGNDRVLDCAIEVVAAYAAEQLAAEQRARRRAALLAGEHRE